MELSPITWRSLMGRGGSIYSPFSFTVVSQPKKTLATSRKSRTRRSRASPSATFGGWVGPPDATAYASSAFGAGILAFFFLAARALTGRRARFSGVWLSATSEEFAGLGEANAGCGGGAVEASTC